MVNEVVYNYLKENKDKYPLELLKKEVLSKGYSEDEYYEALKLISESKFKEGEVAKLPNTDVVKEEKKGVNWFLIFILIILILMFGVGLVVLFNYLGYSFFGFNLFDFLK